MSMIPSSIIAQASKLAGQGHGEGVFSKLSPSDNAVLNRHVDQEDLQFPQELGENEYNQFILFTSYETKGEKAAATRRQAGRDVVTLGEDLDIADPQGQKLAAEVLEAKAYKEDIEKAQSVQIPAGVPMSGIFNMVRNNTLAAAEIYAEDQFDSLKKAKTTADAEIERLNTRLRDAEKTSTGAIIVPPDSVGRSHESFINDRSTSTIEQQKILGIQRRVTEKGRLRLTSATEKSNSNIALYLPNKLVNSGSIGYNNVSFEVAGAAKMLMEGDFSGAGGIAGRKAIGAVDDLLSVIGVASNLQAGAEQVSGLAINPRMQQTFQGVQTRGFDFTFSFAPKNQKEAVEVSKIIRAFRRKAHPSLALNGAFLNLPDEFEIRYYKVFNNGVVAENLFLNKLGRCALQSINVDYTPNGINATFPDGSPVRTSLTMQFTELRPLIREDIEEGY